MKKLINAPGAVVPEMLAGLTIAYPNLRKLPGQNVLARADIDPNAPRSRGPDLGRGERA